MAIRSDEIVNIIKSAIDTFDANAETRNVRNAFVSLLLGLTLFTLAESALGYGMPKDDEGLAACGTQAQPCTLEPVALMKSVSTSPDSADTMTWRITDHGFEMSLSPRVPELIQAGSPGAYYDRAGALRAYEACAEVLRAELGAKSLPVQLVQFAKLIAIGLVHGIEPVDQFVGDFVPELLVKPA